MQRKKFVKTAGAGVFLPLLFDWSAKKTEIQSADSVLVKNKNQTETWFVREQTPIRIFISRDTDSIHSISLCSERMLPGSSIPIHKHLNEDEYFYFLSGEGLFHAEGKEIAIRTGSVAFVPKNTWHGLKNSGSEELVFVFGYTPGGFEDFFRKIGSREGELFIARPKAEIINWAAHFGMVYQ